MAPKEVSESIIMGPGVVETITIDHSISPQQRTTEGVRMASTSPRDNQQTLLPAGSPATLSPADAPTAAPASAAPPTDHGGEATHQWVPAGLGMPSDPDSINGWLSAPWSSTAPAMEQQEILSKIASMSFSSHIMQSGEYQHQTSNVKQWINSFRNLRTRRPISITTAEVEDIIDNAAVPAAFNQPSQIQQIISTSSLKELQRASSFTASPKWSEGYIWASVQDTGSWVNGHIRPTRSITGSRYNADGSKITTASTLWHIHHDPVFSLTSAMYHLSMIPGYGDHQPASEEAAAGQQPTASGQASETASAPMVKWCLINVVINNDVVNSMADPSTADAFLQQNAWMPSRYNRH
eukprot:1479627-Amphidinium_carterae.2